MAPFDKIEELFNENIPFEHLSKAPIVEAAIEIRSTNTLALEENKKDVISELLRNYKNIKIQRELKQSIKFNNEIIAENEPCEITFKGFRLESKEKGFIAQFNKDNFVISKLPPYENWNNLFTETLNLWEIYKELTRPEFINRLGVRFINQIEIETDKNLAMKEYFTSSLEIPGKINFEINNFLYSENLKIPNNPYFINIIRTKQMDEIKKALIFDIDVFTTNIFQIKSELLQTSLTKMRWLKNYIFFNYLNKQTLDKLK